MLLHLPIDPLIFLRKRRINLQILIQFRSNNLISRIKRLLINNPLALNLLINFLQQQMKKRIITLIVMRIVISNVQQTFIQAIKRPFLLNLAHLVIDNRVMESCGGFHYCVDELLNGDHCVEFLFLLQFAHVYFLHVLS